MVEQADQPAEPETPEVQKGPEEEVKEEQTKRSMFPRIPMSLDLATLDLKDVKREKEEEERQRRKESVTLASRGLNTSYNRSDAKQGVIERIDRQSTVKNAQRSQSPDHRGSRR